MARMAPLWWRPKDTTILSGVHHAPGRVGLEMDPEEEGGSGCLATGWSQRREPAGGAATAPPHRC